MVSPFLKKEVSLPQPDKNQWFIEKCQDQTGPDGLPRRILRSKVPGTNPKWVDAVLESRKAVDWSVESQQAAERPDRK